MEEAPTSVIYICISIDPLWCLSSHNSADSVDGLLFGIRGPLSGYGLRAPLMHGDVLGQWGGRSSWRVRAEGSVR